MSHNERGGFFPSITANPEPGNGFQRIAVDPPELPGTERHVRLFNLPPEVQAELNKHQLKILMLLERVARRTAQLYSRQETGDKRGNFYPPQVKESEVIRQSQEDPELLDPYTVVRLYDEEGDLKAYPIHEFYRSQIKELGIINLLKEAASEAGKGRERDLQFQGYLRAKARSLETGDFKASERIWLEREGEEPTIDIVIGPYDTYTDKFLGRKFAWQAWVGVLDRQTTNDAQWFVDAFLDWWREETGQEAPKVKMRIDHTLVLAGQAAKYDWSGNSLPCQPEWRGELGSKFTIFERVFDSNFHERRLPAFREFIDPDKTRGITDGFVRLASLRKHIAHEINHSLVPGENIQQRLYKHTAWLKELYCELMALTGYKQIKGISPRESEIAMSMTLAEGCLEYEDRLKRPEYHECSTILASYLLQKGSIQIEDGRFTWVDTEQVFQDAADLLTSIEKLLEEGKMKSAQDLHREYFDPTIYRALLLKELFTSSGFSQIPAPEESSQ